MTTDTPCRRCQYNLRTLAVDGVCPECGTPVALSVRGDLLRFADPNWVERLTGGLLLIILSALLQIGLIVVVMVWVVMAVVSVRGTRLSPLWPLLGVAIFAVAALGIFLSTAPDPSGLGEDQYGRARRLVWAMLAVNVAGQLTLMLSDMTLPSGPLLVALQACSAVGTLAGVVEIFALLDYLSKLALRIPDAAMFQRGKHLKWGVTIPYSVIAIVQACETIWRPAPGVLAGIGCFMGVVGIAVLIYGILCLLFLDRARRSLREQAALSRETWGAAA